MHKKRSPGKYQSYKDKFPNLPTTERYTKPSILVRDKRVYAKEEASLKRLTKGGENAFDQLRWVTRSARSKPINILNVWERSSKRSEASNNTDLHCFNMYMYRRTLPLPSSNWGYNDLFTMVAHCTIETYILCACCSAVTSQELAQGIIEYFQIALCIGIA